MPRDIGTGLYYYPSGTEGVTAQTIFSARYNTFINDLANTLNQPLPINMGGTGGDSAFQARYNLRVEVRDVQVLDYNTHVWESGSFWSTIGAPGAPDSTHYFMGQCYLSTDNVFLEVRPLGPSPVPQPLWVKHKYAGTWGAWASEGEGYVNTAGDTMTGDLTISKLQPTIVLNKPNDTQAVVKSQRNALDRWSMLLTANAADDFHLWRHSDGGAPVASSIEIVRATGAIALKGATAITGALQVSTDIYANTLTTTSGILNSTGDIVAQNGNIWAPNGILVAGPYALTIGGTGGSPANGMGYDGTSMTLRTSAAGGIYLQAQGGSATFASFLAATTTLQSTTTIVSGNLTVNGDTTKNGNLGLVKANPVININATSGTPALNYLLSGAVVSAVYDNGGGIIVASNGALTAGNYMIRGSSSWTALSDARLPEKVGARPLNMLERVDQIQVYENEYDGKLNLFVIAQEFVKCLPHIIKVGSTDAKHVPTGLDDPDAWGVGYDRAGVAALQLGKEIYDALRQQIAALTARVEALEAAQTTP